MKNRRVGGWVFWAIALLLAGSTALVVTGLMWSYGRLDQLAQIALDRITQSARIQLDQQFRAVEQDLIEEAAFVEQLDSLSEPVLLDRWNALMNAHWAITSVRLANERGDEIALSREDSAWVVQSTSEGSENGPPIASASKVRRANTAPDRVWLQDSLYDPRKDIWFGQALKDRTGDPVWSSEAKGRSRADELRVSMLIRPNNGKVAYRIIVFVMRTSEALRGTLDQGDGTTTHLLLNVDGASLIQSLDTGAMRYGALLTQARWQKDHRKRLMAFRVVGEDMHAQLIPYTLNGEVLQLGSVINDSRIREWQILERIGLWTSAAVIALLTTLLWVARARHRMSEARLRKQEKRSRLQERKLAKALGERDVLDREVHHRVKNNLQVVSSLLNLQAQRIPEGPIRAEFVRGKRRIDAMALVHQKLYGMQDLRSIRLHDLFHQLAVSVAALHEPESRSISFKVQTMEIISDPDTAIELGIILCELLENCFQHAFPYATGGHIDILAKHKGGDLFDLVVKDNGKGMAGDARVDETKLGLEIVEALAGQLDGTFNMLNGNGVTFTVEFRMLHPLG